MNLYPPAALREAIFPEELLVVPYPASAKPAIMILSL
jgi:hypothetical protein